MQTRRLALAGLLAGVLLAPPAAAQAPSPGVDPRFGSEAPRASAPRSRVIEVCNAPGVCSTARSAVDEGVSVDPRGTRATTFTVTADGPWVVCTSMDPLRFGGIKVETTFCRFVDRTGQVSFPKAPIDLSATPRMPGVRYDTRPSATITATASCADQCEAERAEARSLRSRNPPPTPALMVKARRVCQAFGYGAPMVIDEAEVLREGRSTTVQITLACEG